MTSKPASLEVETEETAALVATLQQTVQRLEEFGEIDAVADWKGRTFLLPRAQESHRSSEASKQTAILNALPAHIALLDTNGLIVSVNDGWRRFWGTDSDELSKFDIGRNYLDLCNEGRTESPSFENVAEGVRSILSGRAKHFSVEFRTRARWFLLTAASLAADRPNGAVVMHLDVTAQKRDGRRFRGLLEAAPDAMVVVDHLGDIVLLNLQAEKEFGYRKDELLGQQVTLIIPEGFAARLVADDLRSAEDARGQQIGTGLELMGRRRNGSAFPIEIMLSPLESDKGTLVTAAIRNISVRKAAEQNLAEAERVKRLKDEFVSTVSHELRTPLTSIAGALSLLIGDAGGKLPAAALRLLKIAHTNSQRLVRLINDILDIEKAVSGKMLFVLKETNMRGLCEQVIESSLAQARSQDVRIIFLAPPGDCILRIDPDRSVQILTNLISNAIKFSPSGSEVEVLLEDKERAVRITVRDHGSGIAEGFRDRVFEKFAQADSSDARQKGGTGLGLSIVKQLTTLLGGTAGFYSPPGGGTSFYVELPRREPEAHAL